jgi:hypothetical protein
MVLRQVSVDEKYSYGEVQTIEFNVLVKFRFTKAQKKLKIIEKTWKILIIFKKKSEENALKTLKLSKTHENNELRDESIIK